MSPQISSMLWRLMNVYPLDHSSARVWFCKGPLGSSMQEISRMSTPKRKVDQSIVLSTWSSAPSTSRLNKSMRRRWRPAFESSAFIGAHGMTSRPCMRFALIFMSKCVSYIPIDGTPDIASILTSSTEPPSDALQTAPQARTLRMPSGPRQARSLAQRLFTIWSQYLGSASIRSPCHPSASSKKYELDMLTPLLAPNSK